MTEDLNRTATASASCFNSTFMTVDSSKSTTSFGTLILSHETSQPIYSMPRSTRAARSKTYINADIAKQGPALSPGPKYKI